MSLRALYDRAESKRRAYEYGDTTALESAIAAYGLCQEASRSVALFSTNESIEDVSSSEIRYFVVEYRLAGLIQRRTDRARRERDLRTSLGLYKSFLSLTENYGLVEDSDSAIVAHLLREEPEPDKRRGENGSKREAKIARYKREKALQSTLETLSKDDSAGEDRVRAMGITSVRLAISNTIQEIEVIKMELEILAMAPDATEPEPTEGNDARNRFRVREGDSWRLDDTKTQPLLDQHGKPNRPFVITGSRDRLNRGVFGADHSLPTMSIDQYLVEERARGGILDSTTNQQSVQDEDQGARSDEEQEERERQKAIEWDVFTELNTKGQGNTMMNRG